MGAKRLGRKVGILGVLRRDFREWGCLQLEKHAGDTIHTSFDTLAIVLWWIKLVVLKFLGVSERVTGVTRFLVYGCNYQFGC